MNLKKPKIYRMIGGLLVFVIIMIAVVTKLSDKSPWLSKNEIVKTFGANGLTLKKDTGKSPSDYEIGGIEPTIFQFKEYDGILYIYIFDNLNQKNEKINRWRLHESKEAKFDGTTFGHDSKNATLVLEAPFGQADIGNPDDYNEFSHLNSLVADTVFLHLNDGQTIVYKGESDHWQASSTIKYYNNPIEDEDGKLVMDNYGWQSSVLTYIGQDPENVGQVSYDYRHGSGSGQGSGLRLDDRQVSVASSSGSGSAANPPEQISFTLSWNDQEEVFVLRPEDD